MTLSPDTKLRRRVRQAIERGGLCFDPPAHEAYLAHRLALAEPFAAEIIRRLVGCCPPKAGIEHSLLDGVHLMTAFACTATDCLYRLMAHRADYRDDVRRSFSYFVVGSAVFDYICDEDSSSFSTLTERITEDRLRRAFRDDVERAKFSSIDDPGLLCYATALLEDEVQLWGRLAYLTDRAEARRLRDAFIEAIVGLFHAELQSRLAPLLAHGESVNGLRRIWEDPLWTACLLIALTPDAEPDVDLDSLRVRIRKLGRLLSLIDDVVDLEEDWRARNRNQFLYRLAPAALWRHDASQPPWDALLSDAVCTNYLAEVTTLVSSLSDPIYQPDLAGWLYSWLK